MKTLLLILIVAICAIAWRSPDIMQAIGVASARQDQPTITVEDLTARQAPEQKPMTAAEFVELSKTDPYAYQKYLDSFRVQEERSEVDKLFNFLSRGKYE